VAARTGAHYGVILISSDDDIELIDLVRVIRNLEPMRRDR
jgi:hypothetical protein